MAQKKMWHDYGNPPVSRLVETIDQVASSCRTRLVQITAETDLCLTRQGDHNDAVAHANRPDAHRDLKSALTKVTAALKDLNECLRRVMHA